MDALCTSRRCGPKERASAYGNVRNVTRSARMGSFQIRQPLPADAVPTRLTARIWINLSAKIVGTALVRLCPRLHPDGQFQPDGKSALRQKLAVNNLPACPHALLRRDHNHLLPRPPLPFRENACAVRTHVFGQRPRIRHSFVFRTNLYRHRPRNSLFESASRHRHRLLPTAPNQTFFSFMPLGGMFTDSSSPVSDCHVFYVYVARFACPSSSPNEREPLTASD